MKVVVKSLMGVPLQTLVLDTTLTTVRGLKDMFCAKHTVLTPDMCRLVYGGAELECRRLLADYNVQWGATVVLLPRLNGGGAGGKRTGGCGCGCGGGLFESVFLL